MKSETEINKWIEELQAIAQSDPTTLRTRIAYLQWNLLRRIVEDVVDWPAITDDLDETVLIIEREIDNNTYARQRPEINYC